MFQPLYNGAQGLYSQQRNIDTIGNNVSNIDTLGYKAGRMDFQDNLYTRMFNKADMGEDMNLQRGTGVRVYQTVTRFEQGIAQESGRTLDFMLSGTGFFVFENPEWDGENELEQYLFGRGGNLYVSEEGGTSYLVDNQGRYIMDEDFERITFTGDYEAINVDLEGTIYLPDGLGDYTVIATFLRSDFVNTEGLQSVGNGYFVQTVNSGEIVESKAQVLQGYTEGSNVDLADETTSLIRAQRAYQLAARCVTTADQMMQVCNQLGR